MNENVKLGEVRVLTLHRGIGSIIYITQCFLFVSLRHEHLRLPCNLHQSSYNVRYDDDRKTTNGAFHVFVIIQLLR